MPFSHYANLFLCQPILRKFCHSYRAIACKFTKRQSTISKTNHWLTTVLALAGFGLGGRGSLGGILPHSRLVYTYLKSNPATNSAFSQVYYRAVIDPGPWGIMAHARQGGPYAWLITTMNCGGGRDGVLLILIRPLRE